MKNGFFNRLLSGFLCSRKVLEEKFTVIYYGTNDVENAVSAYISVRRRIFTVIVLIASVLIFAASVASMFSEKTITHIERLEAGREITDVPVKVEAYYGGIKTESDIKLNIHPRRYSKEECENILNEYASELENLFIKKGKGKLYADGDMVFPETDGRYGISVIWSSSDPLIISEEGRVDVMALKGKHEKVTVTAEMSLNEVVREKVFEVTVVDNVDSYEGIMKRRVDEIAESISMNQDDAVIELPSGTDEGIKLEWSSRKESHMGSVFFFIIAVIMIFCFTRYRRADRLVSAYKDEVCREFPNVPERLVLLIDSGMTAFNALMRISSDYEESIKYADSAFGREVADIGRRVKNTNSVITEEWKNFAVRMQSTDMLRFCTILEDNMGKGSELSVKLGIECGNMRETARKNIQKKIRMMDSKMMLPMMLMLFSLLIVAIAPALMDF